MTNENAYHQAVKIIIEEIEFELETCQRLLGTDPFKSDHPSRQYTTAGNAISRVILAFCAPKTCIQQPLAGPCCHAASADSYGRAMPDGQLDLG